MDKKIEGDHKDSILESYRRGKLDAYKELLKVVMPFLKCVQQSSGRIPTETLSFSDWDKLCKAFIGVSSNELSK